MTPLSQPGRSARRSARFWLSILIFVWGGQAMVTQSLLLRESVVLMSGSELAWGVVLFAWLAGVAVGGGLGGRASRRVHRPVMALVGVLLGLALLPGLEMWLFRGARAWLGVEPGELVPLPRTLLAALLLVPPAGILIGMAFPLAVRVSDEGPSGCPSGAPPGSGALGHVYTLESAGGLAGGAAFSFWAVERLSPIQTALVWAAITLGACGALLATDRSRRRSGFLLGAVSGAALAFAFSPGDPLNRWLVARRWLALAPGYRLCAEAESKYQNLAIGQREEQYALYCDGHMATTFPDPYGVVPLAHVWMCQHPAPRRVLVIGGGAEGLLAEVLRHFDAARPPIQRVVDYLEPDARQLELIEPFLRPQDRLALADPRVSVVYQDLRFMLKSQRDRYDLVIARLPEPTSALRARCYTKEFYSELRQAMTDRAVLCMTAAAAPARLSPDSAEYLASIRATLREHFPAVVVGWGDPAPVLAATAPDLIATDAAELTRRYGARRVTGSSFEPLWFETAAESFEPDKLRQRSEDLDAAPNVEVSTDLRPIIYLKRLILWERMTSPASSRGLERVRSVPLTVAGMVLAALCGIPFLWHPLRLGGRRGTRHAAIACSIGTTGLATMALTLILLFAFQSLYGYVYQRIGWLVALFMAGLVIGCESVRRRSSPIPDAGTCGRAWRTLVAVDLLLATLALATPMVLAGVNGPGGGRLGAAGAELAVSILMALAGVMGGAAFALAGAVQVELCREVGPAAGSIIGADHAGACAGALLTGIVLVPVFGIPTTAGLLVAVKLGSAAILVITRPREPAG
ncbi:MAG TPA: hypothetical protein PKY77_00650 [Phycisphaerae bacterium]|nr:hypothetical protein [Phycisphaerae bacterium]HRY67637.1 hypothetical protein [Phycisphaerae bacterium]HSA25024.1 hypothetical protein [Phycisphaerae bacterium]